MISTKCAKRRIRRKRRIFFKTLIACILGMAEGIFIKFYMWFPLNGGRFHCKFGAVWIRHHGSTDVWKSQLCCSCQCTHSVCMPPVFLDRMTHYHVSWSLFLLFLCDLYLPCLKVLLIIFYAHLWVAWLTQRYSYFSTKPKVNLKCEIQVCFVLCMLW